MAEVLQEFVDSRGLRMRVDTLAGVLYGVKILGLQSRNGRTYLHDALAQAAALYEGAKVNVNHPKGSPGGPRDYQDRIGVIRNVAVRREAGLFGDLHFNPKHALAEQLAWDAEHAPENVGLSHNVEARTSRQGERVVVEAILKVQSVDLVADPATTRGLFESQAAAAESTQQQESNDHADVNALSVSALKELRPDLVEQLREDLAAENAGLRGQLEALRAVQMAPALGRPRSREQRLVEDAPAPPLTMQEFVRAIT